MAEGSGSNTAIWVAVITVVGSLLTAVVVNADKWIPRGDKPPAAVAQPSPAAPTPTPTPTTASPAATPPLAAATPTPTPSPSATAPVDISGVWRDDDGSRFDIKQTGTGYEFDQTAVNGNFQMAARQGKISGRDLEHKVEMMTGETGSCSGHLNAAGNKITGNCIYTGDMAGGWTFTMER